MGRGGAVATGEVAGTVLSRTAAAEGVVLSSTKSLGFTAHGADQAITRGFSTGNILKIINEGKAVEGQGRFGPQIRYTLQNNTVVTNLENDIITVFSNFMGTRRGLGKGNFLPFEE